VLYAQAFVVTMRAVDSLLEIKGRPTKGSGENVRLLESGEVDLALVSGEVVHDVMAGLNRPAGKFKVVTVMYSTPGVFVVLADSRCRSISDLKGRPVVWNLQGSGLAVQAHYVMDGLGLDLDKDFEAIYTEELADGPAMVMDSRAAALWGGGLR
jgi:TRAP transporter TAXI family solute receptor